LLPSAIVVTLLALPSAIVVTLLALPSTVVGPSSLLPKLWLRLGRHHPAKIRPSLNAIFLLWSHPDLGPSFYAILWLWPGLWNPSSAGIVPAPILPALIRLLLRPLHRTLHRGRSISRLWLGPRHLRTLEPWLLPLHLLRSGPLHLLSLLSRIKDLTLRLSSAAASTRRRAASPVMSPSLTGNAKTNTCQDNN